MLHPLAARLRAAIALAAGAFLAVPAFAVPGFVASARATPALTMDVTTGDVLYAQEATRPWFPASTTKLMTVYVALSAVRDHQIAMDTPLVVSARAHAMPPSKMGFAPGTQVTLDNALKMLMVRSANDIAITIAEGIGGSVEGFADDMNRSAQQLGLHESHFVNPNGLPDAEHYSSARDMAIIARALYTQFPEHSQLFNIGALALGSEIIGNHNNMLGRYPGADGMKTGFTCSAGFNVVVSAFRDGRRVVAVVFGAPSVSTRSAKVAALLDRAFANIDRPAGSVLALASEGGAPPDMRDRVCRNRAGLIAQFNGEVDQLDAPLLAATSSSVGLSGLKLEQNMLFNTQKIAAFELMAPKINAMPTPVFDPVPVHVGAEQGYTGVVAQPRMAHTAIGSEPTPVAASAYAAMPPPQAGVGGTPLAVDANALPMRGRKAHSVKARRGRPAMKALAEAPKTKVIAEGDDKAPAAKSAGKGKKAAARPAVKSAAKPAPKPAAKSAAKAKPAAKKVNSASSK